MYKEYEVYGPYTRKDGRQHVILIHKTDKTRITVSYPKFLMEQHLGRKLTTEETVDHIDRDFTNNSLLNLQVLDRAEHSLLDVRRLNTLSFICPMCAKEFTLEGQKLSRAISNNKKKVAGPFCGKSCAGKYGYAIQHGLMPALEPIILEGSYSKLDKPPL